MSMKKKGTRRAGQGTIVKRSDGRWQAAITVGYDEETGNPKRVTVYGKTQDEAAKKLQEVMVRKHLNQPLTTNRQKLGEFLDHWLETTIQPKSAPSTYRYYEQMVRLYIKPVIGPVELGKLSAQHVDHLLTHWGKPRQVGKESRPPLKAHSINGIRTTLRSALATAWKYNLIPENPVARVSRIKGDQTEVVYLTQSEVGQLLKAAEGHYLGTLIEFTLRTGLRVGEALGLRWEDIDFVDRTIRIRNQLQRHNAEFQLRPPKSSSGRRNLFLSDRLETVLQQQRANQALWQSATDDEFNPLGLVFTGIAGRPLYAKNVDAALKSIAETAEIKKTMSFHKLRHTVATHALQSGKASMVSVKDMLGHSQISVTVNTYGHAVPSALKDLAELIDETFDAKPSE